MSYLFFLPLVLYVFPPFSSQPLEWTLHTAKLLQNLSLAYAELQDWNSHSSACSPSPRQPSCSPPSQPQPFLPLRSSAALAAPVSPQPVSCLFSTLALPFTSSFLVYQNPYHPPGPVQMPSPFWSLPPSSTPTSLRSEWITLLLVLIVTVSTALISFCHLLESAACLSPALGCELLEDEKWTLFAITSLASHLWTWTK